MLRSDVDQLHAEKVFTLDKIVAGILTKIYALGRAPRKISVGQS
mgnify:CR=1 FL=1